MRGAAKPAEFLASDGRILGLGSARALVHPGTRPCTTQYFHKGEGWESLFENAC